MARLPAITAKNLVHALKKIGFIEAGQKGRIKIRCILTNA